MISGYSYFGEEEEHIYRFIFSTKSGIKYAVYFFRLSEYFSLTSLPHYLNEAGFIFGLSRIGYDDDYIPLCSPLIDCHYWLIEF